MPANEATYADKLPRHLRCEKTRHQPPLRAGVHIALAIKLFQDGTLSLGKAAKLAGLSYEAMVEQLASMGVPVVDYPPEELDAEVAAVG